MKTAVQSPLLKLKIDVVSNVATVNLDDVDAVQLARSLVRYPQPPGAQLVIDCSSLNCQRTMGVNHVISQLLVLRKAGASIWLRNVNAPLRRCLELLKLGQLFHVSTRVN